MGTGDTTEPAPPVLLNVTGGECALQEERQGEQQPRISEMGEVCQTAGTAPRWAKIPAFLI